ncbi:MAG: helix-turn-helix domain-containing protein [Cognatishimia sp.]|uniref:helix-turn-helix domain-containing protein n=1 Tax=Cognatishimia sp. TaxID=2211648 RepID=UPI003B8C98B8
MRPEDIPGIRALPVFSQIDEENFERLIRGAYFQSFPSHIELITEGHPSDFLHILVQGKVELFANWEGRETTMATVHPISSFILAATIKDAEYLMSGRTVERSKVLLIPSIDVRNVFADDNGFARSVVNELAQCYRTVVKSQKDLKLRTSLERLANYLLRQRARAKATDEFDLHMEKKKLASFLGMTPENLSRAFKELRKHGLEITGSQVRIIDPVALEEFAKPSRLIDDYSS